MLYNTQVCSPLGLNPKLCNERYSTSDKQRVVGQKRGGWQRAALWTEPEFATERMPTMLPRKSSFLSPKCAVNTAFDQENLGVFALESIAAGDVIAVFGGEVMDYEEMSMHWPEIQRLSIQVEDDLYLVSTYPSPGDRINHSCNPNAWLEGQMVLVARRNIVPGEMITFDYATSDGSPYDEFECMCDSAICRGRVTGEDWRLPELQERYAGHFSPYLQRRIDRLGVIPMT